MEKKVLVTGCAGFIGSNLVEELLKQGEEVIGIDIDKSKDHFLNDVMYNDKFHMIWDDINNIHRYYDKISGIDEVYHLAASADIRHSSNDLTSDLRNNVQGTHAILELIRKKDIKKLVFSSSSAVYGLTKEIPTPENARSMKPISLYGASKLSNEAFIHAYSDLYGIKSWIFRFANVVGRHQHRGVIFDFFKKLNDNQEELEILGDGSQKKSYFDVMDCIDGLLNIPENDGNKSVEIYNLGNYEPMPVKDLAEVVCNQIGVDPEFKFTGGDRGWRGDVPYTILNIDKALATGWKPQYDNEECVRRTVRYLFDNR